MPFISWAKDGVVLFVFEGFVGIGGDGPVRSRLAVSLSFLVMGLLDARPPFRFCELAEF